jgi:alkylation response protein AidB-like acyl-CoA dehydrogenase
MDLPSYSFTDKGQKILQIAAEYLRTIAPKAAQIDRDPAILQQTLRGMRDRSLLALKVPKDLGGAGLSETDYYYFQILIARHSGALAFLQTQHQSAGSLLATSDNKSLQQLYLPSMGKGEKLVGVGFSQLRRREKPMTKAVKTDAGYLLEGEVPWITGFGLFDRFIIGATLPDGRELYGMLPFQPSKQAWGGKIEFSLPMNLIAMTSTNTVSAKLTGWLLDEANVIAIKAARSIHENSKKNVLHHGCFALGCAYAGLDILENTYQKKQLSFLQESWQLLEKEVTSCAQAMFAALLSSHSSNQSKLQLRAWAINLAGRCSQAAVIASSGAANAQDNAAGRVYREALLFSVSGQTTAVMEESLKKLLFSSFSNTQQST